MNDVIYRMVEVEIPQSNKRPPPKGPVRPFFPPLPSRRIRRQFRGTVRVRFKRGSNGPRAAPGGKCTTLLEL